MGQQSFTPEEILAASFAYTRSTVEGAGAIKGKNCQIQSIDPITGGVRITFVWYLDDGTIQTDTADVMNGADGKGIKSVAIDSDEHLIITYTDNTTSDAGKIEVQSAVTSVNGKKGDVQLKTSDITNDSDYVSDANYVHTDNNYDDTAKGIVDGVTAELAKKVDKVTGKDLSTNDYTDADKAIVDNVTTNLSGKVDKVTGKDLSTNDYTNADKAIVDGVTAALADKVDKVSGKDLSTNDYTNTDKAIVDGVTAELANKADNTDVIDSASYDSTNHTILFKHGSTTLFSLDAAAFVKDGMIDTVTVTGGNLVITFNTDAGKQDISIPISDIFDANNYYNKTAIDNLLSAKQDTLTFDNTPTAGSNNPVKSGGVYAEVNSVKETLTNVSEVNKNAIFNSATKNILPSIPEGTYSKNSVNYTVDKYGVIKLVNGTASAETWIRLYPSGSNSYYVPNCFKGCKFSGITGGSNSSYYVVVEYSNDGSTWATQQKINTGDVSILDYAYLKMNIVVANGYTVNNIELPLMVRKGDEQDATFQPYSKPISGLTANDFTNGAVNLLNPTITSQVVDTGGTNVTIVVNSDGTFTVNGTVTNSTNINVTDVLVNFLKAGKRYKLSGSPSGSSDSTYRLYISATGGGADNGNGYEFSLEQLANGARIRLVLFAGATLSNVVFKPMITLADMPNSDYNHYVPYAMSNKELTQVKETYLLLNASQSITVTADGVKTYKELLIELHMALNEYLGQNPDYYVRIMRLGIGSDGRYTSIGRTNTEFLQDSTSYQKEYFRIDTTISYCRLYKVGVTSTNAYLYRYHLPVDGQMQFTNYTDEIPNSGTIFTIIYDASIKVS